MDYGLQQPTSRAPIAHYAAHADCFISVGIYAHEPGFNRVAETIHGLGQATHIHHSLWHLKASTGMEEAFRQVNRSLVDRRIDGHTGVFVLDTERGEAQWHLPYSISRVLGENWGQRSNLFISFSIEQNKTRKSLLHLIDQFAATACIDGNFWYASTVYAAREIFQLFAEMIGKKDELFVFDDQGHTAMWRHGRQVYPAYLRKDQLKETSRPALGGRQLNLFGNG